MTIGLFGAILAALLQAQQPAVLQKVDPVYPPLAQAAGVEGAVRVGGSVTPDGRVQDMKVMTGHPLLNAAVLDAVRQWRFTTTLAGGTFDVTLVVAPSVGLAVTGTVTDPDGRPLSNISVTAFQRGYQEGRTIWMPRGTRVQTDDRGVYRIFRLDAGEFFIRADYRVAADAAPGPYDRYAPQTYYPAALDELSAVPVKVGPGPDAIANIRLLTAPSVKVSGKIVIPGLPAAAALAPLSLTLSSTNPSLTRDILQPQTLTLNDKLEAPFSFRSVLPGSYELVASLRYSEPFDNSVSHSGRLVIEPRDKNIDDAVVTLNPTVEMKGRVVVRGGNAPLERLRISLRSQDGGPNPLLGAVAADGALSIARIPRGKFQFAFLGMPPGFYVSDLRLGPSSIYADGIINVGTQPPDDVQIVLSAGGGTIEGIVQDSQKKGVLTDVMLVPERTRRGNPMFYKNVQSDAAGAFRFAGLPAGDYKVFAWEVRPLSGATQNPEFLALHEQRGVVVTVRDGAVSSGVVVTEIPK
jgi:TonB family protein